MYIILNILYKDEKIIIIVIIIMMTIVADESKLYPERN